MGWLSKCVILHSHNATMKPLQSEQNELGDRTLLNVNHQFSNSIKCQQSSFPGNVIMTKSKIIFIEEDNSC